MKAYTTIDYDAIIVGSGFGGCYVLHKLRTAGLRCLVIDDAADLGGVWYWNCYRGACVDTPAPLYEFSNPALWKDWMSSEKYPSRDELRRYFDHVEANLNSNKDIIFNTHVVAADFVEAGNYWKVLDNAGVSRTARYFILCTGFAAKPFIPNVVGAETFAGISCHTSKWPQGGIDFRIRHWIDSVTGGILSIDIKGVDGLSLQQKWKDGTYTHLGMMTSGFPNMMFLYGPQGPTSVCNGPTCAEVQGDWIAKTIIHLQDLDRQRIDATTEAKQEWRTLVNQIGETLPPQTTSEYMGTNIPGKPKEMLNFLGGLADYTKHIGNAFKVMIGPLLFPK